MSLDVGVGILRRRGGSTWAGADVVSSSHGGWEGDITAGMLILVFLVCLLGGAPKAES